MSDFSPVNMSILENYFKYGTSKTRTLNVDPHIILTRKNSVKEKLCIKFKGSRLSKDMPKNWNGAMKHDGIN